MYSNHLSAVHCGKNRSIFNAQSVKERVSSITTLARTNAIWMAWVMLASAPIAMAASGAQAGETADALRHKVVSFRDLNLNNPEGAAVLYKRIKSAADEVCGSWDSLSQRPAVMNCINEAVSQAVAQVNRPMLTSLHQAKTGKADKPVTTLAQTR
jgi:UrcA family protein